jgi:hypothetical protein
MWHWTLHLPIDSHETQFDYNLNSCSHEGLISVMGHSSDILSLGPLHRSIVPIG